MGQTRIGNQAENMYSERNEGQPKGDPPAEMKTQTGYGIKQESGYELCPWQVHIVKEQGDGQQYQHSWF